MGPKKRHRKDVRPATREPEEEASEGELSPAPSPAPPSGRATPVPPEQEDEVCHAPKKREKLVLAPEDEDSVAQWFQDNPCFFNKHLKGYRDQSHKDRLLEVCTVYFLLHLKVNLFIIA